MVYDLKAGQRRFEVRIHAAATDLQGWGIAMLVKEGVETAPFHAVGATRLLALEALQEGSANVLAKEDWIGIRNALTAVRAV
jgi:hypothetical protein